MKSRENGDNRIVLMLKQIRKEKGLLRILLACVALVIVTFAICIVHINQIMNVFKTTIRDNLVARIESSAESIEQDFERRSQYISVASSSVGASDTINKKAITATLSSFEATDEFDKVFFVKKSNSLKYYPDGKTSSVMLSPYIAAMGDASNGISLFRNFDSEVDEEIAFGTPLVVDGMVEGYLVGTKSAVDILRSYVQIKSPVEFDSYLIEPSGDIIAYGRGDYFKSVRGSNFYANMLPNLAADEFKATSIAEEMQMGVLEGNVGEIENDVSSIMYGGLGNSGWMVVFNINESDLLESLRPIILESIIAGFAVLIVMFLMLVVIGRYAGSEQEKIQKLSYVDELTEAPNENAFKERTAYLLKQYTDIPYLVCCFDILNFRYINEVYGHQKADMLLRALSQALAESYTYNEAFGRIGADRFVGLVVDDGRAKPRIDFINTRIKDATSTILMNYPIRIKTGIYYVKDHNEDVSAIVDKANLARKAVDVNARGELVGEYREQLMEETRKQEQIESRMEEALANGEFVPFFQPKWDMVHDHICGAEALVRWRKPDGNIVPPGDFIPVFESNGFIEKIDFYMLDRVCSYIRNMIDQGRDVYPVSINQSRFLMHNPEYISKVQQILLKYKIPKGLVELELTETVFFHEQDRMLDVMRQLKDFNMNLSIDDFGSGYSSLNLLRDIPFDVLKIDRGFLDESAQSASGKWILKKIVEMAAGLNLKVICEGVETREQVEMLLEIGCNLAQGYLYSRPIPLEEFVEKYNILKTV